MKKYAVFASRISVMTALVAVATCMISVPIPPTRGYINVGDAMVMISALLFGPIVGMIAGGVGSALADMVLGYGWWAPYTLIIKGLEGLVAGLLYKKLRSKILATLPAGAIMVLGYLLVETVLYGYGPALVELPGNTFQAAFGIIVGICVAEAMEKRLKVKLPME
ncbi:ECF transporter S component [archaeon]|nr:MAG: ECF transporter S component [archaeon]HDM23500.1 ECF transporter S component [Candidatus Bathyarchaeota archaeon]